MLEKFFNASGEIDSKVARGGIDLARRVPTQEIIDLLRPEIITGLASGEIFLPQMVLRQALEATVKKEDCSISKFDCLPDSFYIEVLGRFRGGPGNAIVVQKVTGKLRLENLSVGLEEQRVDVRIVEVSLDSEGIMSKFALWIVQSIFAAMLKEHVARGMAGVFGGSSVEVNQSNVDPSVLHVDFSSHPLIRQGEKLTSMVEGVKAILSFLEFKNIEHREGGIALKVK